MLNDQTTVLCAEDNQDLAQLLEKALNLEPDLTCLGCVHRADEIAAAIDRLSPDVLVLDLSMPGGDTLALVRDLQHRGSAVRVVVYSGHDESSLVDEALDAGVWGYVCKHGDVESLVHAIRRVSRGEVAAS